MSNVLTTYTLDTSQPQAELEKYRKGVVALTSEEEKALIKASATAKTRAADLKREEKALRELMKLRKETNNPVIIKQYDEQIKKTVGSIQRLNKETRGTAKEIEKVSKETKKLGGVQGALINQMKQIGVAAAAAFSVRAIFNFTKEAVQLAATMQGVERAFTQLGGTQANIDALTKATRGTVAEVELLQVAVRAKNFGIAFEQLPRLLQFATDRAIQTGQSVDYLVNSIVDGIGRKSTAVIRNLGISAEALQEEIKKTGDFAKAVANLIEVEMGKAGTVLDTTATKTAQLNTRFQDLKLEIGNRLTPIVNELAEALLVAITSQEKLNDARNKRSADSLASGRLKSVENYIDAIEKAANQEAIFADIAQKTGLQTTNIYEAKANLIAKENTALMNLRLQVVNLSKAEKERLGLLLKQAEMGVNIDGRLKEGDRALLAYIGRTDVLTKTIATLSGAWVDARKAADDFKNGVKDAEPIRTLADLQAELAEETRKMTEVVQRGGEAFFAHAAEVDRLKKQIEDLLDPLKAAREAEEAARKEREAAEKAIDSLIQGLEKQRDQLTMTNEEILRNELAQLGANEATIERTLLLRKEVEALKEKEAAEKAVAAEIEAIVASTRTQEEKDAAQFARLNLLYTQGIEGRKLSYEDYARALNDLQDEIDARQDKGLDDEKKRTEDSMKTKEDLLNAFAKSNREILEDLIKALLEQAKATFLVTDMTLEEYEKIVKGINNLMVEASAGTAEQLFSDLSGAIDGMKEFLNVVGGDSAKFLMFQKVLTGIQIALDTAAAISSVIKYASSSSPDPVTLAAKIAAGVGIVLANMAAAVVLFKGAPDAQAPTYAKGGYTGTGIGHKDHTGETVAGVVHAKEYVINKGETAKYKPMLEAINKGKWPEYFAQHYAPFAAIDARPNKAQDKGFAANIAKALQIEFDDRLEGALKRIERKTGTTKVTNLHELGKYFKRNYWGPNTRN